MPRKNKLKRKDQKPYVKPDYHSQNKNNASNELYKSNQSIQSNKKWKNKLRTANDIYNRLLWDYKTLDINLNNVLIGYTDKVLGDQEINIQEWVPIDKGGDVPQHHIMYFKYNFKYYDNNNKKNGNNRGNIEDKTVYLWHRASRNDLLFKNSGETEDSQKWMVLKSKYQIVNEIDHIGNDNNETEMKTENNNNFNWQTGDTTVQTLQQLQQLQQTGINTISNYASNENSDHSDQKSNTIIANNNNNNSNNNNNLVIDAIDTELKTTQEYLNNIPFWQHITKTICKFGIRNILTNQNGNLLQYFPRYPTTNDGFVLSFAVENSEEWLPVLNKYGFVVLKNVFTEVQCDATIESLLNEFYYMAKYNYKYDQNSRFSKCQYDINRRNQEILRINLSKDHYYTWENCHTPSPKHKYLNNSRPPLNFQAIYNRCNDKMYNLWKTVYNNDKKINVSIDNVGVYRATMFPIPLNTNNGNNQHTNNDTNNPQKYKIEERKDWRGSLDPHWDINPWQYNNDIKKDGKYNGIHIYQGAVSLANNNYLDGTHIALPGCIHFLDQWCKLNENLINNNKDIKHKPSYKPNIFSDDIIKYMQPIPLRKGEMIIWDYGQLHATSANYSDEWRFTQYIRYYPSMRKFIERDHYGCQRICDKYKKDINLKEILRNIDCFVDEKGRIDDKVLKIFGLKKWV